MPREELTKKCVICGKEFKAYSKNSVTCSRGVGSCYAEYRKQLDEAKKPVVWKNCLWCDGLFETKMPKLERFCTDDCEKKYGEWLHGVKKTTRRVKDNSSDVKLEEVPCDYCGKMFEPKLFANYCSGGCRTKAKKAGRKYVETMGKRESEFSKRIDAMHRKGMSYADAQKAQTLAMIPKISLV